MGPGAVWGVLAAESWALETGSPSGLYHNSRCSTDASPTSFPDHNYLLMAHINALGTTFHSEHALSPPAVPPRPLQGEAGALRWWWEGV